MKDRIKKFCNEHVDEIAFILVMVPLSAFAANQFVKNQTGGNVSTVYHFEIDGIEHVDVVLRNNLVRTFHKLPKTEA